MDFAVAMRTQLQSTVQTAGGRARICVAVALVCLSLPIASQAQVGAAGTITGRVRGPGGVAVPGATVEIIEKQTGARKATWTDEAGNYILSGVEPGTYKLDVSLVGFRTDVREPVPVSAGKSLKVNVALVMAIPAEAAASAAGQRGVGSRVPNLNSLPPEAQEASAPRSRKAEEDCRKALWRERR